jgi:hypothetical protein
MQYGKLDAALAASLGRASTKRLPVFVRFHDPRSDEARTVLRNLGLEPRHGEPVVSLNASPKIISELSDLSCIRSIQLSGTSRLL